MARLVSTEVYVVFFKSKVDDPWVFWNDYSSAKGVRRAIDTHLSESFGIIVWKVNAEGAKHVTVRR